MVQRGKFVLYDGIVPALKAGDYQLETSQALTSDHEDDLDVKDHTTNIRVTAPRYTLTPDHILSAFPPANSEGAYESRLPQVVLKRRTLPWDRAPFRTGDPEVTDTPVSSNTPWLALVVIAEGEGELSVEKPIADCVTEGVPMAGPSDVAKGVYLAVPETTVRKVFPTVEDLRLLAHVREVNKDDTENAMGDDDGFMAVVMANRLPQFDREACKPVRYIACLVNLEGQLHVLPKPTPPTPIFLATAFVFNAVKAVETGKDDPDLQFMGSAAAVPTVLPDFEALTSGVTQPQTPKIDRHARSAMKGKSAEWASATASIEATAVSANSSDASFVVRDAMKVGFRIPFEYYILEKTYRFPVLTHWSFTCTGAGSLDTILQNLDVGLLGTLPGADAEPPRPECRPEVGGSSPEKAPLPRPDPEVTESGHVGLPHQSRDGEHRRAWYRGPFTPHATQRKVLDDVSGTVLAHVSDQLRATVPDGREELSLAIAFEIGRLLALSRPSIVAGMMRWRREQFGATRSKGLAGTLLDGVGFAAGALDTKKIGDIGRLLGRDYILEASNNLDQAFGNTRPIVDPARPIPHLDDAPIRDISKGLGIDIEVLSRLQEVADISQLDALKAPIGGADQDLLKQLDAGLDAVLTDIFKGALLEKGTGGRFEASETETSDALDRFLDAARIRREREIE